MLKMQKHFSTKSTPQSEPIPGKDMVQNNAGGYSFAVDAWERVRRFLILGSEGGTYYISEKKLTIDNAKAVQECLKQDPERLVNMIVEISDKGRAPKNDPALFALAIAAGDDNKHARNLALRALPKVARIGTHLFHFVEYAEGFRGWGRSMRKAIQEWYLAQEPEKLMMQVLKYKQRDGWSHRDLLRLSHPKAPSFNEIFKYVVKGELLEKPTELLADIEGMKKLKHTENDDIKKVVKLIQKHKLPREVIPTEFLKDVSVWKAMLPEMPITATIRNLGKMSSIGILKPLSSDNLVVIDRLTNIEQIKKGRVHPLQFLIAMSTYSQGRGDKGSLTWNPVEQITDALEDGFYKAFDAVEPTGKRIMLCLDVSGSMAWGNIASAPITPQQGSTAMAMVTARTEKNYHIMAFDHGLSKLNITAKTSLKDAMRITGINNGGGTDCSLPMVYAKKNNLEVDCFIVYTDNETWAGKIHPKQALDDYRRSSGIDAKCIVVGMTASEVSIADPSDPGMLDIVGFDTSAPQIIREFIMGEL